MEDRIEGRTSEEVRLFKEAGLLDRIQATRIHSAPGSPAALEAALALPGRWLGRLPASLLSAWLATERGHLIVHAGQHGYVAGANIYRDRLLLDVAWLDAALYPVDEVGFLTPAGYLAAGLVGWNSEEVRLLQEVELLDSQGVSPLKAWDDFVSGVNSCFRAGYGRSQAARTDVTAYLAEGIAWFLADRRGLNVSDPRLEKLLAATVFNTAMYR